MTHPLATAFAWSALALSSTLSLLALWIVLGWVW